MKKAIILGMILLVFVMQSIVTLADIEYISECRVWDNPLNESGKTYVLANDINASDSGACFSIDADNVTLDCEDHSIVKINILGEVNGGGGIASFNSWTTIKNCNIKNFQHEINLTESNNSLIYNNTINSNPHPAEGHSFGILLQGNSNNNTINKNTITNSTYVGIWVTGVWWGNVTNNTISENFITNNYYGIFVSGSDNLIYNNYFNNTINTEDYGSNFWNTTKTLGTSIIDGPYIGGNFWSNYNGTDSDGDGIGDTPYEISGGTNKDYLPLVNYHLPSITNLSWWNSNYNYRKNYTINSVSSTTLEDFPIYLSIDTASLISVNKMRPDCNDLRFVDNTNKEMGYEFENATDVNFGCNKNNTIIWVKVPSIATDNSTVISMYYGYNNATSGENITGTWNPEYHAVWHFAKVSSIDSTSFSNNLGIHSGSPKLVIGKIGMAVNNSKYTGDMQYVLSQTGLNINKNLTIEAWVKRASIANGDSTNVHIIAYQGNSANEGNMLRFDDWINSNKINWHTYANGYDDFYSTNTYSSTSAWYYIVVTYNAVETGTSIKRIYVNGVQGSAETNASQPLAGTENIYYIGGRNIATIESYFDGIIDEVRMSNVNRSADWIKMEYYTVDKNSEMFVKGNEESPFRISFVSPTIVNNYTSNNFDFINVTSDLDILNATLEWNGIMEPMLGSGKNWFLNKTDLLDGNHTFTIFGITFDNIYYSKVSWVVIDTSSPIITNSTPSNNGYVQGTPSEKFKINVNDLSDVEASIYYKRLGTATWFNQEMICSGYQNYSCEAEINLYDDYAEDDVIQFYYIATDIFGHEGFYGTSSSPNIVTIDITPPQVLVSTTNSTNNNILRTDAILLSVKWQDNYALDKATLSTNETGVWLNYTNTPLSGISDWSNFTWHNSSIVKGTVIGWKVYSNDVTGNENSSNVNTFTIWEPINSKVYLDKQIIGTSGEAVNITCQVDDSNSAPAQNYPVEIYDSYLGNLTLIKSGYTDYSGKFTYNLNASLSEGLNTILCAIYDNNGMFYRAKSNGTANLITDYTSPILKNYIPTNYIKGSINELFQIQMIEQNINSGSTFLYYKRLGTPTWKNQTLNCFGSAPNYLCNTTVDLYSSYNENDSIQFYFTTTDRAGHQGNNGTSSNPNIVIIDRTIPNITIISPNNMTYTTNTVNLIFMVNEKISWSGYSLDNGGNVTSGNTSLSLSYGPHHLIVFANDSAGNMGFSEVYLTVFVCTCTPWKDTGECAPGSRYPNLSSIWTRTCTPSRCDIEQKYAKTRFCWV